ncbi:MAG: outer membrane protein assembly factor BamB family protein, partial [Planctomycetota bacterium]
MLEPIIRFATWLAVASAAAAAAEPDGATRWPGFRGDGSSISTARDLPLRWGEGDGVAWTATLPGFGQSSPVVWDGTVFVTSGEGDMKQTLVVNAIGLRDGKTRWTRRFDAEQRVERTDMVSQSAPTPAVDADRVYAFFESGDLIALDHEGRTLWHRRLGEAYGAFTGPHGLGSSVALTSDAVVVLIDDVGPDYLLAVDKVTGATRWKVDRASGGSWTTPLVSRYGDREEIVVSSAGIVEAFDAADGTRLWHVDGVEKNTVASPTAAADLVVIPSSDRKWNIAIGRDGAGDVGATHVRWRTDARPPSFGSPLVHGGSVYYVSRAGIVTCVSLADGSTRW